MAHWPHLQLCLSIVTIHQECRNFLLTWSLWDCESGISTKKHSTKLARDMCGSGSRLRPGMISLLLRMRSKQEDLIWLSDRSINSQIALSPVTQLCMIIITICVAKTPKTHSLWLKTLSSFIIFVQKYIKIHLIWLFEDISNQASLHFKCTKMYGLHL